MEEEPRKKTLKCKFDLFSWVVIIMYVPKFDIVNSILANEIDFRMSMIMPYSYSNYLYIFLRRMYMYKTC